MAAVGPWIVEHRTYNSEVGHRESVISFQLRKSYFEIYPTAVARKKLSKTVNNFEYFYKRIFILEKEALETISVKLNYGWKILALNT
jgi:hypothetical protein